MNGLLRRAGFAFPASVAMLLLLFGALVAGRAGLGERRMRVLVAGVGGPVSVAVWLPGFVRGVALISGEGRVCFEVYQRVFHAVVW